MEKKILMVGHGGAGVTALCRAFSTGRVSATVKSETQNIEVTSGNVLEVSRYFTPLPVTRQQRRKQQRLDAKNAKTPPDKNPMG